MNSEIALDNIVDAILKANRIVVFAHVSPDGDAVGSCLGMYFALEQLRKNVDIVTDEYSRCFAFLPGISNIKTEVDDVYDLAIALDCATKPRLYDPKGAFDKARVTVNIDHHVSNTYYANYNYVEGESPAVCKTLVKVFKRLGVNVTQEIGTCLMAGIITDSGGFRYQTVDGETFEFAAQMIDIGVNISDIYYRTFDVKTKPQFMLSSIATNRLEFYSKDRVAVTYVTQEDFRNVNASAGDHEGIVNIGRNIEGVEVSIFLREVEPDLYRVSLRSNEYVNVSDIAGCFDGGGHSRAAGCDMHSDLKTSIKKLVRETNKYL